MTRLCWRTLRFPSFAVRHSGFWKYYQWAPQPSCTRFWREKTSFWTSVPLNQTWSRPNLVWFNPVKTAGPHPLVSTAPRSPSSPQRRRRHRLRRPVGRGCRRGVGWRASSTGERAYRRWLQDLALLRRLGRVERERGRRCALSATRRRSWSGRREPQKIQTSRSTLAGIVTG